MFKKDYLMRLVSTFLDALNQIINSIDKDDVEGAKIQITNAYRLLGNTSDYFLQSDIKDIFLFFKEKDGDYLKRVQMLSELMYCDAKIETDKETRIKLVNKAILFQEHYIKNSNEYSFQMENRLEEMRIFVSSLKPT